MCLQLVCEAQQRRGLAVSKPDACSMQCHVSGPVPVPVCCPSLQVLWLHYLERFRNLQYLEAQLEGYHKAEQDAAEAAERRRRKMQRRLA